MRPVAVSKTAPGFQCQTHAIAIFVAQKHGQTLPRESLMQMVAQQSLPMRLPKRLGHNIMRLKPSGLQPGRQEIGSQQAGRKTGTRPMPSNPTARSSSMRRDKAGDCGTRYRSPRAARHRLCRNKEANHAPTWGRYPPMSSSALVRPA